MPRGRPQKYATDEERLTAKRANDLRYRERKRLQNQLSLPIPPDVATSTPTALGIRAPELDIPGS
jgi:hypothetical protein